MKPLSTIIIFIFIIKNILFSQDANINRFNIDKRFELWKKESFFIGANIHPYKLFSPFTMKKPITREDLIELKKLGANLVVANFPGVFTYFPPYEIDSLHLRNLDRIVKMTFDLKLNLVVSIRSGPGRSLYTFFDKKREDEFFISDSLARIKYIEMCQFLTKRYKNEKHIVGINFVLEPHSDDPINIPAITDSEYFDFVGELIKNVRKIDQSIPIIVQPLGWAYPDKFSTLKKLEDDKIIYSFNMYFPHSFTNEINDSSYPGFYFVRDTVIYVDSNYLEKFLRSVIEFKQKNDVPIFVNEYGGIRYKKGFVNYLRDLHNLFLKNGFHFSHYVWKSEWSEIDGSSFDEYNYLKGSDKVNNTNSNNELINEFKRVWNLKKN